MPTQTQEQKKTKENIIGMHKISASDTGSSEVQIALLTKRINELTMHMRKNQKDFSTQRGLLKAVGQRKRLLAYLRDKKPESYLSLIQKLELRK